MTTKVETVGERVVRQWLESEHGDEDIDDAGSTIRDWFDYADVSRQDLEQRITASSQELRVALEKAWQEVRLHFDESDLFRKRMARIIEPLLKR